MNGDTSQITMYNRIIVTEYMAVVWVTGFLLWPSIAVTRASCKWPADE